MSATPPEGTPPPTRPEGTIRCARCGADVPPDHDWCLECGLAARTRVAPTPRWRVPLLLAGGIAALALAALAVAFVDLTKDPAETTTTTVTTGAPPPATQTLPPAQTEAIPPVTTTPTTPTTPGGEQAPDAGGATTTPPAATIPPATTTPPATTSPQAGTIPGATIPGE